MLRCSTIAMFSLLVLACSTTVEQRDAALEAGAASCVGHCGEQAPSGCFCDEDCHENGDCCADAEAACSIEAAEECGPGEEEDDGGDDESATTVCFMGPNRTNDVCLPLSFPGTPSGYSYPAPLNSNYRAPIAYLDLNAIDGNTMIAPNFKLSEFAQVHKGRWAVVQPHAVKRMQTIRDQAGAMSLNSGYRSPTYNASVDGASKSRHMYGDGFDFKASALSVNALEPKCTSNGGFLVEYTSHVHCDWRNDAQDAKFFGSVALLPGAPDDFTFELPFEARIVEVDGVLTAPAEGFDEGEPVRRWIAWSADGEAIAEHTGPEFVAPEDAVSVTVDVGRVVEAELTLE